MNSCAVFAAVRALFTPWQVMEPLMSMPYMLLYSMPPSAPTANRFANAWSRRHEGCAGARPSFPLLRSDKPGFGLDGGWHQQRGTYGKQHRVGHASGQISGRKIP